MKPSFAFVALLVLALAVSSTTARHKRPKTRKNDPTEGPPISTTTTQVTEASINSTYTESPVSASTEEATESTSEGPSTTEGPTTTESPEQKHCNELTGKYVNETWVGLEVKHDVYKILEQYGGPPGKVNATWTEKEDAPVPTDSKPDERPLPDADEKYWIYRYGASDGETFIRAEHAVRRFSGTPKAFVEIRGTIFWTPKDYCGNKRRAEYVVDDRGFTFDVSRETCWISSMAYGCTFPISCFTDADGNITSCVAAPSSGLLAALVGGGK